MRAKIIALLQPLADRLGIPADKLAHFLAGLLLSAVLLPLVPALHASMLVLAVAVAWEVIFHVHDGKPITPADVWVTWAGGSILPILSLLWL